VVSFMGDGFIELDGHNLGRKSSIGLVFATTQPDALLLFSDPYKLEVKLIYNLSLAEIKNIIFQTGQTTFYTVSLHRGQLHVRVGGGKGVTTVRSGNFFNDGKPHSVSVIKTNRRYKFPTNIMIIF
jgi:Laminin G domain